MSGSIASAPCVKASRYASKECSGLYPLAPLCAITMGVLVACGARFGMVKTLEQLCCFHVHGLPRKRRVFGAGFRENFFCAGRWFCGYLFLQEIHWVFGYSCCVRTIFLKGVHMSNPLFSSSKAFSNKTLSASELRAIYERPSAPEHDAQGMQGVQGGTGAAAPAGFAQAGVMAGASAAQQSAMNESAALQDERVAGGFAVSSDDTGRVMTVNNTIAKALILFLCLVPGIVAGWLFPVIALPAALIALVLGLVNSFKKQPSVPLIVGYAVFEGGLLGAISHVFEANWAGIVSQAVLGTLVVFVVTLLLFRSGRVRTSPKMNRFFLVAMVGYLGFSLVNAVLMFTGVNQDPWGLRGATIFGVPVGVLLGVVVILLASYSLIGDFEFIQNGVSRRLPERFGWVAAFGLLVTLVWLYLEILRLIAILRGGE